MRGHHIRYSADERQWLKANCHLPIGDYHRRFNATFARDVAAQNLHALRVREGWKTGRTGQFTPGQTPANKGKPCPDGVGGRHPNARATQFKPGHGRTGFAVDLYKPIGTERISKDGYLERKIHDGRPLQTRWRGVHLINWEAANGPLPKGGCLKSRDGDKTNLDPANWMLIDRAILPTLNGGRHKTQPAYDQASPELRPALLMLARVKVKAARVRRDQEGTI